MTLPSRDAITPEFLKENDGKLVWIRDDYLMMNGVQGPGEMYDFLDHVWNVKEAARQKGAVFTA